MSESTPNEQEGLLQELVNAGIKHSPEKIVAIRKDRSGKVIFLESGNSKAGLSHITTGHGSDFMKAGIAEEEIVAFVMEAAINGEQVAMQGTRPVFRVLFKEKMRFVAVQIGTNGYIVGANPVSSKGYSTEEEEVGNESH